MFQLRFKDAASWTRTYIEENDSNQRSEIETKQNPTDVKCNRHIRKTGEKNEPPTQKKTFMSKPSSKKQGIKKTRNKETI